MSVAISDGSSRKGATVCSVGASVVLDGARALESSGLVDECVAVDGEWAVAGGLDDWRGGATKGSSECLDVGSGCCGCAGGASGGGLNDVSFKVVEMTSHGNIQRWLLEHWSQQQRHWLWPR